MYRLGRHYSNSTQITQETCTATPALPQIQIITLCLMKRMLLQQFKTGGTPLLDILLAKPLPFLTSSLAYQKRGVKDLELIHLADGFLLFKFHSYDAGQQILDEGPLFVYGSPLILRRWTADISMSRDNLESIPVWVRLPNLNFCFRTSSALSKIATVIGNPICMNRATSTGTRYAFARVCVEIGIDTDFPTELRMKVS
ncbi:hypothetical protein AAC387_Pa10g0710 [Persea americana]